MNSRLAVSPKSDRGFTLIEVLVALLVFGLIATSAYSVGAQYVNVFESVRSKTLAGWVADNAMTEIRLAEKPPGISETNKEVEFATMDWRVNPRVIATQDESMHRVEITVFRIFPDLQAEPRQITTLAGFLRIPADDESAGGQSGPGLAGAGGGGQ